MIIQDIINIHLKSYLTLHYPNLYKLLEEDFSKLELPSLEKKIGSIEQKTKQFDNPYALLTLDKEDIFQKKFIDLVEQTDQPLFNLLAEARIHGDNLYAYFLVAVILCLRPLVRAESSLNISYNNLLFQLNEILQLNIKIHLRTLKHNTKNSLLVEKIAEVEKQLFNPEGINRLNQLALAILQFIEQTSLFEKKSFKRNFKEQP